MLIGKIYLLTDVGLKIVQLCVLFNAAELPFASSNRFEVVAPVIEICFVRRAGARPAFHQRPDISAVDYAVGGYFNAGQSRKRRQQVNGTAEFATYLAGGDFSRPAHNARLAHTA